VLTIVLDGTREDDMVGIGNLTRETSDTWTDAVGVADAFVDVGLSMGCMSSS
jgi:hypothetical protein